MKEKFAHQNKEKVQEEANEDASSAMNGSDHNHLMDNAAATDS